MTKAAWILFYCAGYPAPDMPRCQASATAMYDKDPRYFESQEAPIPYPGVTVFRGGRPEEWVNQPVDR